MAIRIVQIRLLVKNVLISVKKTKYMISKEAVRCKVALDNKLNGGLGIRTSKIPIKDIRSRGQQNRKDLRMTMKKTDAH